MDTMDTIYTMDTIEKPDYINTLYIYTNQISYLLMTSKPDTMIVVKRIFHITNLFLRNYKIDTKEKAKHFNSIFRSISYAPPWDSEDVIFDHLHKLCEYLSIYYSHNEDLEAAIIEDIQNITIIEEIKKILEITLSF